ncbi:MAG: branched-chain amino acid ABC transporter permease [Pseudomonadota bacterium]
MFIGLVVLVILILLPLAAGTLISDFYLSLLIRIFIFALVLLGFDILLGYTGQASFGHAMFFGTGAYLTAILLKYVSTSIWLALGASIAATTLIGLIIGYLSLRSRGLYFIFLTFAFGQFFYLFFNSWMFVGAADGMAGIPAPTMGLPWDMSNRTVFYYFTLAFLVLGFLVARHIVNSALGRVLMGIRQNEERVAFLGYNVQRCMLASFVISAVYAGVAGCLYAGYQNFVSPSVYHWGLSGQILIMNLIGGMGTLIGPMIGSAFVIYFGDLLSSWMHETWLMVLGAVYVIFILFSSGGIAGLAVNLRSLWINRRAA